MTPCHRSHAIHVTSTIFPVLIVSKEVTNTISGSYVLEIEGSWQSSELTTYFTDGKTEA